MCVNKCNQDVFRCGNLGKTASRPKRLLLLLNTGIQVYNLLTSTYIKRVKYNIEVYKRTQNLAMKVKVLLNNYDFHHFGQIKAFLKKSDQLIIDIQVCVQ